MVFGQKCPPRSCPSLAVAGIEYASSVEPSCVVFARSVFC